MNTYLVKNLCFFKDFLLTKKIKFQIGGFKAFFKGILKKRGGRKGKKGSTLGCYIWGFIKPRFSALAEQPKSKPTVKGTFWVTPFIRIPKCPK